MCENLLKNPLLSGQFRRFKDSYGIPEGNQNQSFRRFVNYTLFRIDDPDVFVGKNELLDSVCAGDISETFDGIGIQVNGVLVRSCEDIDQFRQSAEKLEIDIVFVKIGYDKREDVEVFAEFCKNIQSFFTDDGDSQEGPLMPYYELVDYIYSDKNIAAQMDSYPRLKMWFVPAYPFTESKFAQIKNDFISITQEGDYYFGETDLLFVSGKDLVEYCKELENRFTCTIKFKEQLPLAVSETNIDNAISFICEAKELMKLMVRDNGSLRRSLFNDNVRDYLGYTTVNAEIENTIREQPDMFLLCNNGITIVCGKFELARNKTLSIEDPQIVNGCQTCNSLYNLRNESTLERVQVQIRLIWTDNIELTNMIVRGTNKQNYVLDEAFETLRPFHQELESYFDLRIKASPQEAKLYYERRNKQYSNDPAISKNQIVNLRIITQSFVAMFMGLPHIAHRHEAKLLELFGGDNRVIYCDNHGFDPYFVCSYTWYSIDQLFRKEILPINYRVYSSHLYLLLRYSFDKVMPQFTEKESMRDYCNGLMSILLAEDFLERMNSIIRTFDQVLKIWVKQGGSVYAVKDRKDFTELMTVVASNRLNGIPKDQQIWYYGEISRFYRHSTASSSENWYAIIRPESGGRLLPFDSRDYDGPVRDIVPGCRVKYILKENPNTHTHYAWQVTIIDRKGK